MKSLDERFEELVSRHKESVDWENVEKQAKNRANPPRSTKSGPSNQFWISVAAAFAVIFAGTSVFSNPADEQKDALSSSFSVTTLSCKYPNNSSRDYEVNRKVSRQELINMCSNGASGNAIPVHIGHLTEDDFEICEISKSQSITVWLRDARSTQSRCE